jgi:hypothetical protein
MNKITKNYEKTKKVPFKIAGVGSVSKLHVVSGAPTIPNLDLPRKTIDVDFLMRKYPYLRRDELEKVSNREFWSAKIIKCWWWLEKPGCEIKWIVHGGDNGNSIQEAIVNIYCEEREHKKSLLADTRHIFYFKKYAMTFLLYGKPVARLMIFKK